MKKISKILLINHTHTDLGYTHSQPVVWRLHRDIIHSALDLCEATANRPAPSRLRWTCEVTSTLEDWLGQASEEDIERFRSLVKSGQMGAGAFFFNMTPMLGAADLDRSLQPALRLRESLGLPFRMAINHDVNGLPWAVVSHLLDHGVDSLMMGINPHFGGHPLERPLIFDWEGPDGRTIRTFNSEHYCSFHRWMKPQERSLQVMTEGLDRYLESLEKRISDYPHDFILLSATHFDFVDNNPPDEHVAEMVHRWNEAGNGPLIECVTSDQLAEYMHQVPLEDVPRHRGDWPDFWNFGSASSARETRINRQSKARLTTIPKVGGALASDIADLDKAWWNALVFDEHTWGSWAPTWNHEADDVPAGICHKFSYAYEARSLTSWVLRRALEKWVGNPKQGGELEGIAICNPAPNPRAVMLTVPTRIPTNDWHHFTSRIHSLDVRAALLTDDEEREVGPFLLPAMGHAKVNLADVRMRDDMPPDCRLAEGVIESPHYRLEFDEKTGAVTSVIDRELGKELIDLESEWDFFGFVRESVDGSRHEGKPKYHGRDALFDTDFEKLSERMESGWQSDWPALREKATGPSRVEAVAHPLGPRLLITYPSAPGVTELQLEITLPADRKAIMLEARFHKNHTLSPEGIYFTFPLALTDWRAWYDSASIPVELDAEQLPGAVRDYQTVESFVSVASDQAQVSLACPDAAMVQIGGFNFGKNQESVPRNRSCLLLAWPMNTYWDTNFPASQPGFQRFRYELTSAAIFDAEKAAAFGRTALIPVEFHPVLSGATGVTPLITE